MKSAKALAKTMARPVRWQLDQDYIEKLSPEDQDYLAKFLDEYYNGRFAKGEPVHQTEDLRRSCYRNKNNANRDAYGRAQAVERLNHRAPRENELAERDMSPMQPLDAPDEEAAILAAWDSDSDA